MTRLSKVIIVFVILVFSCSCQDNSTENRVERMVTGINKKCPVLIDEETLFKGLSFDQKHVLTYTYQLIHFEREKLDTNALRKALLPGLLANIKIDSEMKDLRDAEFLFRYFYTDKAGKDLCKISIGPEKYK